MANSFRRSVVPFLCAMTLAIGAISPPAFAQEDRSTVVEQANRLLWKNQYKAAVEILAQELQKTPKDPALLGQLGDIYRRWGKMKQAVAYFEQAVQLDPTSQERWSKLADAYRGAGNPEKAYEAYRKVLEMAPSDPQSYEQMARFWRWERRQPAEALAVVEKGIPQVKEPSALHQNRADILESMGRLPEAIEAMQMAIKTDPHGNTWLQSNLGRLYVKMEDLDRAWQAFLQATKGRDDTEYRAWIEYGSAFEEFARFGRARKAYEKAMALDPKNPEAYIRLANLSRAAEIEGETNWREAEAILKQGLQQAAAKVELYNALASLYQNNWKYQEALEMYEKARAAAPERFYNYYSLGSVLLHLGQEKEALQAFQQSEKQSEDPETAALVQMGNAYQSLSYAGEESSARENANEQAVSYYKRALLARNQDADLWQNLASTYARLGQYDNALEAWRNNYRLREEPGGDGLALLEVARTRRSMLESPEGGRSLFVMHLMARAVPDNILEPFRQNPELYRWMARLMEKPRKKIVPQRGEVFQQQEKELKQAATLLPDNPDIWQDLGLVQYDLGQPNTALETWEKAAVLKKVSNPRAWALNMRANRNAAELEDVLARDLGALWEEVERYPDVISGKRTDLPVPLAEVLARNWPTLKRRLQEVLAQARYDAVKAVELQPSEADYHLSLARIDWFLERQDDALQSAQKAVQLDPQGGEAYLFLSEVYLSRGDRAGAIRALEQGLAQSAARGDDGARLGHRLVRALLQAGDRAQAIVVVERLCRRQPRFRWELRRDKVLQPLRAEPRIQALLD